MPSEANTLASAPRALSLLQTSQLRKQCLRGLTYLEAATKLLLRARGEDRGKGLYEAADIQWWWREDGYLTYKDYTFWYNDHDEPVACLLVMSTAGRTDADLLWTPSYRDEVIRDVWPFCTDRLIELSKSIASSIRLLVSDQSLELVRYIGERGFIRVEKEDIVQFGYSNWDRDDTYLTPVGLSVHDNLVNPIPKHCRPIGFRPDFEKRMAECSVYDPALDLYITDPSNHVVAYCIVWFDQSNRSALVEPLFVNIAFRRSGLGIALLSEGIARVKKKDCCSIRVSCDVANGPAASLYKRVGFERQFLKLRFVM